MAQEQGQKAQTPGMKAAELGRLYYIGASCWLVAVFSLYSPPLQEANPDPFSGLFLGLLALVLVGLMVSAVCMIKLHYRLWTMVQEVGARTTPAKAVWLSVVPVFNLYWLFVTVCGLALDFNKLIARRHVEVSPISIHLAVSACVLAAAGIGLMFFSDLKPVADMTAMAGHLSMIVLYFRLQRAGRAVLLVEGA